MDALEALYAAAGSPIGIVVMVSSVPLAKSRLYAARTAAGDPALEALQIRTSPYNPENELWIVKGAPPSPSPT